MTQDSSPSEEGSFRFVVLTDTHINASESDTASPWDINRHANARARAAVAAINDIAPDFVVHLGDVIQPLPSHAGYDEASRRAAEILDGLTCPINVIPGNHDVGDKPLKWNPAKPVSDSFVAAFRRDYGFDRLCFEHGGCVFVGIDAQLINSGLDLEAEQWRWIETTLQETAGKRVFFFLHYPPYICTPDEHEHYDNLGEPGRSRLLNLFERYGIEACFSGHVHNFFYNLYGETRSYTLPALSFVRHDYSGLFPVPPVDESFGRDDGAKLGLLIVDVGPEGHRIKLVRSHGQGQDAPPCNPEQGDIAVTKPFREPFGSSRPVTVGFGATLRSSWAHVMEIAPSGAVDEFRRKPARDDYFLAALWESGVSRVRIPLDDLEDAGRQERVRLLAQDGFAVQIYCFGLPRAETLEMLTNCRESISAIEIILPVEDMEAAMPAIEKLGRLLECETVASPLVQSGSNPGGRRFVHFIAHGFSPDEQLPNYLLQSGVDGIGFRIAQDMDPLDHAAQCMAQAGAAGKTAHIHIATGDSNPALLDQDVARAVNRAVLAYVASKSVADTGQSAIWLDTLSDVDRGYFPRLGLIDRRSNPAAGAVAIDALARKLSQHESWSVARRETDDVGETIHLTSGEDEVSVILPSVLPCA